MNTVLPTYDRFVRLEHETLQWLQTETKKRRATHHIGDHALRTITLGPNQPYAFETYIDVEYENREARIFVGGQVIACVGDCITDLSYYISLVDTSNTPSRILRKYHFDYTCDAPESLRERRRNHPYFHMQYCGELPGGMRQKGITEEQLRTLLPEISEPRIACAPMSIALLFELLFNEFPTKATDAIRKDGYWKKLVMANQTQILKKYHEKCLEVINKPACLSDYVYSC
jgi:hypothetical protein